MLGKASEWTSRFFDGPWGHILTMTLYPVGKRAFQAEAATGQRLAGKNAQENAKR